MQLCDYAESIRLPSIAGGDYLTLTRDTLPVPAREFRAPGLAIRVGQKVYSPDFAVRSLDILGTQRALRGLGLALLGQSFCAKQERITLRLSSPAELAGVHSVTHQLDVLLLEPAHELMEGAQTQVSLNAHCYSPIERAKHPWFPHALPQDLYGLPAINVVDENGDDAVTRAHEVAAIGFGTLSGTLRMADFLLDISQPDSPLREFVLEGEPGFRGVAPASCEVKLWLPGSLLFDGDQAGSRKP